MYHVRILIGFQAYRVQTLKNEAFMNFFQFGQLAFKRYIEFHIEQQRCDSFTHYQGSYR